jgi:hypothetical protein
MVKPPSDGLAVVIPAALGSVTFRYDPETHEFSSALYRFAGTREELVRVGACRLNERGWICPRPRHAFGRKVCIEAVARWIVPFDAPFQRALHRVVSGSACVDFSLPAVSHLRRTDPDGEAAS